MMISSSTFLEDEEMEQIKRDFTELSMMSKTEWSEHELVYFQHALSQLLPYINPEGLTILHEINKEMYQRKENLNNHPIIPV